MDECGYPSSVDSFCLWCISLVSPICGDRSSDVTFLRTHEFLPNGSMSGLF
jgi:hypothetical protein